MPTIDQTKGLRSRQHTFGRHGTTKSATDLKVEAEQRTLQDLSLPRSVKAGGQGDSEAAALQFGGSSGMVLGVRNTGIVPDPETQTIVSSFDTGRAHTSRSRYLDQTEQRQADDPSVLNRLVYRDLLYNMVGTTGIEDATNSNLSFAQEYWGISYPDNDENNVSDFPLSFLGAPDVANRPIAERLLQNVLSPYVPNLAPNSLEIHSFFAPTNFPFGSLGIDPSSTEHPSEVAFFELIASPPPGLLNPSDTSQYGTVNPKPDFDVRRTLVLYP